jgi:hypothetical protein
VVVRLVEVVQVLLRETVDLEAGVLKMLEEMEMFHL